MLNNWDFDGEEKTIKLTIAKKESEKISIKIS